MISVGLLMYAIAYAWIFFDYWGFSNTDFSLIDNFQECKYSKVSSFTWKFQRTLEKRKFRYDFRKLDHLWNILQVRERFIIYNIPVTFCNLWQTVITWGSWAIYR